MYSLSFIEMSFLSLDPVTRRVFYNYIITDHALMVSLEVLHHFS